MRRSRQIFRASRWLALVALIAVLGAVSASGQPRHSNSSPVQRTSFDRAASHDAGQTVRFGRPVARIGDRVEQTISLEMRLATSLRQENELVAKSRTAMRSAQRRVVTTTAVDGGRSTAVLVRYLESTKQLTATDAEAVDGDADSIETSPPVVQVVQGKAYRCRREPGEGGKLIVTDEHGNIPPLDEYEIVAQGMEMVGRVNPLAQFLAEKTIAVGETVELPLEIADRLFNLGDRFGEVTRFDLTLEKLQTENGAACVVFLAEVEAASTGSSQMRLQVEGPLAVEIHSCRAVRFALSGPLGLSETRGSYSTAQQLIGTGHLKMSIASAYRDAKR